MARAKKGATSKGKGGGRSSSPSWLWMVTGLAVGLFIAFLVFLGTHGKPGAPAPTTAKEAPAKPEKKPEPTATKETKETKPATGGATQQGKTEPARTPDKKPMDYSFYKTLPKFEVKVPPAKNEATAKHADQPAPVTLQVGAFKSAGEADARKAQLALLGIVSSVQVVNVEGKPSYHRVRVGPLRDPRLAEVRQALRENQIDYSIAPP